MINLLLTLSIGLAIGYALYKMKVPGGLMVGAIVGVAILNILFGKAVMPSYARTVAQIIAGAFIGCSVEAMLTATPAGATDMALISSDLGVQSTDLIVLQIIRLIAVVSVFPQIINLIVILFK